MNTNFIINPIGNVKHENGKFLIKILPQYREALTNIKGFSHLQILWWGNLCDKPELRSTTVTKKPYKTAPDLLGIFATHSPVRPNPILLTTIAVENIDEKNGTISTWYIDAENNTPVLDIKPYHLLERVKQCSVPDWCKHWPQSFEDSSSFNWEKEFNF